MPKCRTVPADGETMGEVVMRGNIVMKGYFDDAEATEKAFAGGWFHSGDIAVLHPDGSIELRDRKKDIIISGGRTSARSKSNRPWCRIRPCWSARWCPSHTKNGVRCPRPS